MIRERERERENEGIVEDEIEMIGKKSSVSKQTQCNNIQFKKVVIIVM